ncbi:NACHT domain-containing protein [Nocardia sp. NPDC046473]|uniref:NACHT domain-containing protein n=1 Tax=Nocardia sp. NPDC046473 TaxID=3155733 RepID=UPI0033F25F51
MSAELLAVRLGTTLVSRVASLMLARAHRNDGTRLDMDELIRRQIPGLRSQRSVRRQFEQVADAVAARVEPMLANEFRDVDGTERTAVVNAIADAFTRTDFSDAAVFQSNADPAQLSRRILAAVPPPVGFSASGTALYNRLVAECCEYYVQIVRHLPVFTERAVAELLSRVDEIGQDIAKVIEQLPRRSLYAPDGADHDEAFRQEYLELVSKSLDEVEVFSFATETPPRTKLSVAYISLSVSMDRLLSDDSNSQRHAHIQLRVEEALSDSNRVLLRGEAGSGKTTLLRWLAINAARGSFTGALTSWNRLTPVLVRLRRYSSREFPKVGELLDDVAGPITGHMPPAWVDRQLSAGSVLLLVDGVDELLQKDRGRVREWITRILHSYQNIRVVVTSRPVVVDQDWLIEDGFTSISFERMSTEDLNAFVRQWHQAVAASGQRLPCAVEELPHYERSIIASLRDRKHLHAISSNPLLAAVLCSLHLIRYQKLPRNRMELYQVAVELLIDRRDADRHVPSAEEIQLSIADKVSILRDLAWRLSDNNLSELDIDLAQGYVSEKLATMRHIYSYPDQVMDHLLNRSGILRSPAVGRLEFVHRSFQEYLAAAEIAAQDRIGNLIGRADQDLWRDVVVMTAGHANRRQRNELVTGILNRANSGGASERQLRMLAISCLETIESMPPELADRLKVNLVDLVPPQNYDDAVALASIGDPILWELPRDLDGLSTTTAISTIQCVMFVGGAWAMELLAGYAEDPRWEIHEKLCEAWHYFEPSEYAHRVFPKISAEANLALVLRHPSQVAPILTLPNVGHLTVAYPMNLADVPFDKLLVASSLSFLSLTSVNDLDLLSTTPSASNIRALDLVAGDEKAEITNHASLAALTGLSTLRFGGWRALPALVEIPLPPKIYSLGIGEISDTDSLQHLTQYRGLRELDLAGRGAATVLTSIAQPLAVERLWLSRCDLDQQISTLGVVFPALQELHLLDTVLPDDLSGIAELPWLSELKLVNCTGTRSNRVNLRSIMRSSNSTQLNITVTDTAFTEPESRMTETGRITVRHGRQSDPAIKF